MDSANEELSKRLPEVLDVIGTSEYTRKKYRECSMVLEIARTLESSLYSKTPNKISYYQVGSKCEGTLIPGIDSDLDLIYCFDESPVVENVCESKLQGTSYLILTDEDTEPGYVCLQIVQDKYPLLKGMIAISEDLCFIDDKDRKCLRNSPIYIGPNTSRHGPARTIPAGNYECEFDEVYALRCRQIPKLANSWLNRIRKYDWPSQKQLKAMTSYGCFFVGVAHPQSNNKSSEWRISFSLQERDLMSSLNETQHKCYILLKIIKKDLIEPKAGESISSYHCKTSLFYTIENLQRHFWTLDKLILCVQLCLKRLFDWVKARNCPNYFIPEANMFDKLSKMTLEKVEYVLNDIINSDIKFLYSLTCINIGGLLKSSLRGDELFNCLVETGSTCPPRYVVCSDIADRIYHLRNWFIHLLPMPSDITTGYMNGVMQYLLYLQFTNHVTEHTTRDVRLALDALIPHIALQYKQCMYTQYLSQRNLSDLQTLTTTNIIQENSECDLISSKLSLASFYIHFEQYQDKCRCILVSCEKAIEPSVISVCRCHSKKRYTNTELSKQLRLADMSSKHFRQCTTGCLVFHQSQISLVPEALQYEMFRNVFTQPRSNKTHDYWLNWITVDSHIYLYFLQFLIYSKAGQITELKTALDKLMYTLDTDPNLGHRETAFNLLGWIYLQGTEAKTVWRLFCLSWKVRPFKNAAKWHMLILLREIIKGKYGY